MTAPAPRADGRQRLHVHKVAPLRWVVDTGHNTLVLDAAPDQRQALAKADRLAKHWF